MLDRVASEDESRLDEFAGRLRRLGKAGDPASKEVKSVPRQRRDQAVLGSIQAVDGAGRRTNRLRDASDRERVRPVVLDDPLGRREQRYRGAFIVLTGSAHP
jgi:hypothetical protein